MVVKSAFLDSDTVDTRAPLLELRFYRPYYHLDFLGNPKQLKSEWEGKSIPSVSFKCS